ncbi:uncharacterized protein G6M90_00g082920 [Metarhizium brunneum]|uniref:Uncharacterized protein n=1 Tax=Metarhizium brunneum TaxID=500148 RepID=A0A7D5V394_9HYPO
MKSFVTAVAAASLVGMGMAQTSPRPKLPEQLGNIERIPTEQQLQGIDPKDGLDACHKIDSITSDGWQWPCGMQRSFGPQRCVLKGETDAARKDQQRCICESSTFFKDADACLDCKVRHALIGDEQDGYYQQLFAKLQETYCKAEVVNKNLGDYYNEAEALVRQAAPYNGKTPGFTVPSNKVERQGHSAHPRDYYSRVGAPEKQGEINFKPSPEVEKLPAVNKTVVNQIPDPVNVPVMVIVALDNSTAAQTSVLAATTTAGKPLQPTTLVRATSMNSTTRATPSAAVPSSISTDVSSSISTDVSSSIPTDVSSSIPADVQGQVVQIGGKLCLVYVYFAAVDCVYKQSPDGKTTFYQYRKEINWFYGFQISSNKQFDLLKEVADACPDGNCKEQATAIAKSKKVAVKEVVKKETVVPGKPQQLPPPEKPTTGGNSGVSGHDTPVSDNGAPVQQDDGGCGPEDSNDTPDNIPSQGRPGSPAQGNTKPSGPVTPQQDTPSGPAVSCNGPQCSPVVPEKDTPSVSGPPQQNTPSGPTGSPGTQSQCAPCADERKDGTEICRKKEETEGFCNNQSGAAKRDCICSKGDFGNKFFFNEAITCARRSANCLFAEFEAQVLFEAHFQYCQENKHDSISAALESVKNVWSARAPRQDLM